ncbi:MULTISPECIES: thioredoxin family protein [Metabacillus]|jgi:thioredoxin-like negative regulator of GroEL|uniref:Thioredoxin n=1 Tax=Metabacillus indicus TaxID=246786 RepID=A0A084GK51_METID|nr:MULTISPECIES: thioredoxin family protein [Metabacillus]KEZ47651.1 thioredoxin [Metabacillus indicus LMG 22858]KEZ47713.1 thioredoxin [Metabacillus indicus]
MKPITSEEQFQTLITQDQEVLIKFFADWCPDCTRMNMFIGEIMESYSSYEWYEINKDEFPEIAEKYQVMGIPSILIFKNGEKLGHLHSANAKTPDQVTEFLQEKLG